MDEIKGDCNEWFHLVSSYLTSYIVNNTDELRLSRLCRLVANIISAIRFSIAILL